jgi:hypothetical protein
MKFRLPHDRVMVSIPSNATCNGRATALEPIERNQPDLRRLRAAGGPGIKLAT